MTFRISTIMTLALMLAVTPVFAQSANIEPGQVQEIIEGQQNDGPQVDPGTVLDEINPGEIIGKVANTAGDAAPERPSVEGKNAEAKPGKRTAELKREGRSASAGDVLGEAVGDLTGLFGEVEAPEVEAPESTVDAPESKTLSTDDGSSDKGRK